MQFLLGINNSSSSNHCRSPWFATTNSARPPPPPPPLTSRWRRGCSRPYRPSLSWEPRPSCLVRPAGTGTARVDPRRLSSWQEVTTTVMRRRHGLEPCLGADRPGKSGGQSRSRIIITRTSGSCTTSQHRRLRQTRPSRRQALMIRTALYHIRS